MNESSKSRMYWTELEMEATRGRGIDIGCGPDPVTPDARRFDVEHGDANRASAYLSEKFDFVYSSHCLEHMYRPTETILDWWSLVNPGGYLFVVVPDEDLYEQGVFPSRFNDDHKATFTISKARSWSPLSHNVLDLARSLPGGEIVSLSLQDRNYDRTLLSFGKSTPGRLIRALAKIHGFASMLGFGSRVQALRKAMLPYYPIDQTVEPYNAQAQIQLIVRKSS